MNIILFEELRSGIPATIPGKDERTRHILRILKLGPGDTFRGGVIDGPSGSARIDAVGEDGITFTWTEEFPAEPLYPVSLLVGLARPICMKRILRDAASLGAGMIIPVGSDLGEKSYGEANLWKTGEYLRYLVDGAQQAGSTGVPDVAVFGSLDAYLRFAEAEYPAGMVNPEMNRIRIYLDNVNPDFPLSKIRTGLGGGISIILAVGPERGWSDRERNLFRKAGFSAAGIGRRILRTETACCAGMAVLLSRMSLLEEVYRR